MYKTNCPDCTLAIPVGSNVGLGGWWVYTGFWFWKKRHWKICKLCNGTGEIDHG